LSKGWKNINKPIILLHDPLNDLYDKKDADYGKKNGFNGSRRGLLAMEMASIWGKHISPMPAIFFVLMKTRYRYGYS